MKRYEKTQLSQTFRTCGNAEQYAIFRPLSADSACRRPFSDMMCPRKAPLRRPRKRASCHRAEIRPSNFLHTPLRLQGLAAAVASPPQPLTAMVVTFRPRGNRRRARSCQGWERPARHEHHHAAMELSIAPFVANGIPAVASPPGPKAHIRTPRPS